MARMHLIHGPQGAAKSAYARQLATDLPGVRFSIDEWMSALFVPDMVPPLDMGWLNERLARCETLIWDMAGATLRAGGDVVMDLGFLRREQRDTARRRAVLLGCDLLFHMPDGPRDARWSRVLKQADFPGDEVPGHQGPAPEFDPPSAHEAGCVHAVTL